MDDSDSGPTLRIAIPSLCAVRMECLSSVTAHHANRGAFLKLQRMRWLRHAVGTGLNRGDWLWGENDCQLSSQTFWIHEKVSLCSIPQKELHVDQLLHQVLGFHATEHQPGRHLKSSMKFLQHAHSLFSQFSGTYLDDVCFHDIQIQSGFSALT